ncbi:acyl-CoA dehydrogenase family protein [Kitasatospora sp. NPDC002965]|uniref:acyl-CoA dehydrogenase family protein n=1 Tax=Kitasatospora sp. NPDC002965 TaxID=3154775 RepID=UPI0033A97B47
MNRTSTDLARYRDLGREGGLAAGLAAVLEGVDAAATAPGGVAVLPAVLPAGTDGPGGTEVLPHPFAALDGLALVRFAADTPGAAPGPGLTGRTAAALTAVRIGVLSGLLDAAVERLSARRFGGVPLIDHQFVGGSLADVATEAELAWSGAVREAAADQDAPAGAVWARHERLTEAGWAATRLFGAEGYLTDHPARSLHLSALTADLWLARPSTAEGDR